MKGGGRTRDREGRERVGVLGFWKKLEGEKGGGRNKKEKLVEI